jgi:hypothetical protein
MVPFPFMTFWKEPGFEFSVPETTEIFELAVDQVIVAPDGILFTE